MRTQAQRHIDFDRRIDLLISRSETADRDMSDEIEAPRGIDIGRAIDLLISQSETADRSMGFASERGPSEEPRYV